MSHPFPPGPADPAARCLHRAVAVLTDHRAEDEPVAGELQEVHDVVKIVG